MAFSFSAVTKTWHRWTYWNTSFQTHSEIWPYDPKSPPYAIYGYMQANRVCWVYLTDSFEYLLEMGMLLFHGQVKKACSIFPNFASIISIDCVKVCALNENEWAKILLNLSGEILWKVGVVNYLKISEANYVENITSRGPHRLTRGFFQTLSHGCVCVWCGACCVCHTGRRQNRNANKRTVGFEPGVFWSKREYLSTGPVHTFIPYAFCLYTGGIERFLGLASCISRV